jgi:hypothetical protein
VTRKEREGEKDGGREKRGRRPAGGGKEEMDAPSSACVRGRGGNEGVMAVGCCMYPCH